MMRRGVASDPLLIAEIGVNHDGNLERARAMVIEAAKAGFDAVKFQFWHIDELLAAAAPAARYQGHLDQHQLLSDLLLEIGELDTLLSLCREMGMYFGVTPDGPRAAADVLKLGPDFVKVGSGDANNPWLLEKVAASTVPLVLSTGMMSMNDVRDSLALLTDVEEIVVLHCVSAYPTPLAESDLGRIDDLRQFGLPVGFSDHTIGSDAASAAVALGAVAIEKHVTYSTSARGPDHAMSLPLDAAAQWVRDIRDIATAVHRPQTSADAEDNRRVVTKGIYATHDLAAGHILSLSDLMGLRPLADGISVANREAVTGRTLIRDKRKGEPIDWKDLDASPPTHDH